MLLIIDNYDSFTYNIAQYFQCLQQQVVVIKNDAIDIRGIEQLSPSHLVISPGPNAPKESGISLQVIHHFYRLLPILGICLGHQCLSYAFGGQIIAADVIMHGKTSLIHHQQNKLFHNIPSPFSAMRYHSLAVDAMSLPDGFTIDAVTNNTVMAISHRQYPLFGLQFHPESILSEHGLTLLANFLNYEPS